MRMYCPGVVASGRSSRVAIRTIAPGSITRRAPKRSTHPPTSGRRTIDTVVDTAKSRPTCVLLPPRPTMCSGSVALSR